MGVMACKCCTTGCSIGADPLNANTLATNWTVISGSASTASLDHLAMTASNTFVVFNTADGAGGVEVNAQVDCVGANSGDVMQLAIKHTGSNDYWYAELTLGSSGTLRIFKRISGTTTQLATITENFSAGTTYTLHVCYGDGAFSVTELTTLATVRAAVTTTINNQLNAALACGSITSNVQFKNFQYNHGHNASGHTTCQICPSPITSCAIANPSFGSGGVIDATHWTVISGTWSESSGSASTSSANATLMLAAPVADFGTGFYVTVTPAGGYTGSPVSPVRIKLNFVDDSNHYAAEFGKSTVLDSTAGHENGLSLGYVKIIQVSGGVETILLEERFSSSALDVLTFCYDPGGSRLCAGRITPPLSTNISDNQYIEVRGITAFTSGQVAIGTVATPNGAVTFGSFNFQYANVSPFCKPCAGTDCLNITVTLSTIANTTGHCTCSALNGTYSLRYIGGLGLTSGAWRYDFPSPVCNISFLYVHLSGGAAHVLVLPEWVHLLASNASLSSSVGGATHTCGSTLVTFSTLNHAGTDCTPGTGNTAQF